MASNTARVSLREYQLALSERLQSAHAGARTSSKLGLRMGGEAWLVDLMEAGEGMPGPAISPGPLAPPWFKGVANGGGNFYGGPGFLAFVRGKPTAVWDHAVPPR